MRPTIFVTSSKGDNIKIYEVIVVKCDDKFLCVDSFAWGYETFDKIPRDRDIELVNVEVEDIGL